MVSCRTAASPTSAGRLRLAVTAYSKHLFEQRFDRDRSRRLSEPESLVANLDRLAGVDE